MSWHYSRALVEAFWAANCSAGALSAQSSAIPTPQAYLSPDRMTAFSRLSRFGMTFAPLTDDLGAALLTWFLAGFRVRTSASQERAQASPENAADYGKKWPASLARYDPATSSWKTHQSSLLAGLDVFSETWPRWGMMRNGECSALSMPVLPTNEIGSGLWPAPRTTGLDGGSNSRKAAKARGMWPTARSSDGERGGRGDLIQAVRGNPNSHYRLWQTPVADDAVDRVRGKVNSRGEPKLSAEVKLWPTPTVQDSKNNGAPSQMERNTKPRNAEVGGSLNPTWVEWLMGWPLGWTDLKPLGTDKFPQWLHSHGLY